MFQILILVASRHLWWWMCSFTSLSQWSKCFVTDRLTASYTQHSCYSHEWPLAAIQDHLTGFVRGSSKQKILLMFSLSCRPTPAWEGFRPMALPSITVGNNPPPGVSCITESRYGAGACSVSLGAFASSIVCYSQCNLKRTLVPSNWAMDYKNENDFNLGVKLDNW